MRLQDLFENLDDDNKIQVMSKAVWRHIDPQISSTGSFKPIKLGEIPAVRGANLPLQTVAGDWDTIRPMIYGRVAQRQSIPFTPGRPGFRNSSRLPSLMAQLNTHFECGVTGRPGVLAPGNRTSSKVLRVWRNWYTQHLEEVCPTRAWEFESPRSHQV